MGIIHIQKLEVLLAMEIQIIRKLFQDFLTCLSHKKTF